MYSPKLRVRRHLDYATFVPLTGAGGVAVGHTWAICLRVVNERKGSLARRVEVRLVGLEKEGPDGKFVPVQVHVPLPFRWTPSELGIQWPSISNYHVFDFGRLDNTNGQLSFRRTLMAETNNLPGIVQPGETWKYLLEVHSDDTVPTHREAVLVSWDGSWSADKDQMRQHFTFDVLDPIPI